MCISDNNDVNQSQDNNEDSKRTEIRIIDENPYEDMFRQSINACKKCKGNGIIIPKNSNEPEICTKCDGHGYATLDNNDVIIATSSTCVSCLIM